MKQFDWEKFKNTISNIAVHCKTEEEAKDFCNQMHKHGMKWRSGKSYSEHTKFDSYFDKTCYYGDRGYSNLRHAERNGYTILEWSNYMQKEFTKADLKDGMVVETRERGKYIVLENRAIRSAGFIDLNKFGDDLTECSCHNTSYDIVRVFKVRNDCLNNLEGMFEDCNLELIWERKAKRMTAEEMRQKLEELTGEKIEVEPNRNEMIRKIKLYCSERESCAKCVLAGKHKQCDYWKFDSENLKQCYEKVTEDE